MISFTEEELVGVPKDVISGYTKRTEGFKELYDVTFKNPDIFPVVSFILSKLYHIRAQPRLLSPYSSLLKIPRSVDEP